jgi:hypothetical protein
MANSEEHRYYQYDPSIAAAGIFTALFALSTVFHLIQMMRTKTWYLVPFVLGGLCKLSHSLPLPSAAYCLETF